MKIIDVEAIWLRVPRLKDKIEWGEDAFVVRIYTDSGLVGVGESDSSPAVLKAIVDTPPSHSTCVGLRDILIGEDPLDIQRLWLKMFEQTSYMGRRGAVIQAISAIDIALWDLAGKHFGVPVYQLLGGKFRDTIDAYATFIPVEHPAENGRIAAHLLESGIKCLKFGGGNFGLDPSHDVALVKEIRSVCGYDIDLAIDMVYRWKNYRYARQQAEALYEFNLAWIEEPISSDDHVGLKRLSESISTRVSGGECLGVYEEFDEFIRNTQPDIVQPDVTRCGGITEMRRIYELAQRNSIQLVPHGFSTGILLAATTQFLASVPNGDLIEYSKSTSPLAGGLVANHLQLKDGKVEISNAPGLGVSLDEDMIKKYRVEMTIG
jgi:L-alanine-DL-glutamate epimerase-like enolase superfamily enzyme